MKRILIGLLIFLGYLGCKKETTTTVVALELRHNQSAAIIEWDNTMGSYTQQGGKLLINAECVNGEIFKLILHNISDTGRIDNLNIQQIYFAVDGEFSPTHLQSGSMQIDQFNSNHINGNFQATLVDGMVDKKIEGKFVMHLGK